MPPPPTFPAHADTQALAEPAVLALVAVVLVHGAVAAPPAAVGEVASHRALEEALAALAGDLPVVLPAGLVPTHQAPPRRPRCSRHRRRRRRKRLRPRPRCQSHAGGTPTPQSHSAPRTRSPDLAPRTRPEPREAGRGRGASWELQFCRRHVTGPGAGPPSPSVLSGGAGPGRCAAPPLWMRGPLVAAGARGAQAMAEGPLARAIRAKLDAALQPTHLQVLDESPRHGGPPGAESHFAVVVVSERFAGLPPLQRHRLVHAALDTELAGPLHALAIVARTPQQWQQDPHVPPRPPCLGGSKQEHPAGGERGAPRDQ